MAVINSSHLKQSFDTITSIGARWCGNRESDEHIYPFI